MGVELIEEVEVEIETVQVEEKMRIAQGFLREAIQLVAMKKPPIASEVEEGVANRKLGENRTYKLYMQSEEDNSPVYSLTVEIFEFGSPEEWLIFKKQVKQALLRGDTLTVLNNEQAMFEEQTSENLKYCLNAMTVQVFPNKVYKLQKGVVKLNNHLAELPMPARVEAKKLEQEELLEVLENKIPTSWNFQIDKEGFDASSSTLKDFTKLCVCYKECEPKLVRATPKERGNKMPDVKQVKRLTMIGDDLLHNIIQMVEDITIASTMGIATTPLMSADSTSTGTREARIMNRRADPTRARRCVSTVARLSLVSPLPMEARTYTQLSKKKLPRLLAARKRKISTSLRPYPSCLEAMAGKTVIATPGSATPLTKQ
eukprot:13041522-Ditylum_brightwellii.AAC.1